MKQDWAVVGGGMLGGVAALRLSEAGHNVTLFESQASLGGLTSQCRHDTMAWDRFYHVIEDSDIHLLTLLKELNLDDQVVWDTTKTNYYDGKSLYPLNNALDYLKLPALSSLDKIRIGLTILYGSMIKSPDKLESIPLTTWLKKWSGESAFNRLWLPLLRGKLGDNYQVASAAFIWSVIQRFYGARSGVKKTETFGYVSGGYASILEKLDRTLEENHVSVLTGHVVRKINKTHKRLTVFSNADEHIFDRILITIPSPPLSSICEQLSPAEKQQHSSLKYQGVVCVSLLLSKPLGGAYLTYITDEAVPFTTVIEMTTLVGPTQFGEKHLVYLPKYIPADHALFEKPDEEITQTFVEGLRTMFPHIDDTDVLARVVSKARHVTTIPTLNYREKIPSVKTAIPGLYICNSAHITNAALSVNESVNLANTIVGRLLNDG